MQSNKNCIQFLRPVVSVMSFPGYNILTTLNGKFLLGVPPIEVYRASIEYEVGWPAFATVKGKSLTKHEV